MSLAKRFTLSLYWNLIGKVFLAVVGFLISVVIARGLGKDNLGIYASLLTIPVVFRLFTSFGLETILNLKLPSLNIQKNGKRKIRFLIRRLFTIRAFTIIVATLILYFGSPLFARIMQKPVIVQYSLLLSFYFAVLVGISLISMIFRALLQLKAASILEGLNQVINLILILVFFYMGYKITGVIWAFIISTSITIIAFFFIGKDFFIGETDQIEMDECYHIGITSFLSAFFAFGFGNQIDIILLNYFGVTNSDIGVYYLSITLSAVLAFLINGIGSISQSAFSESYEKNRESGLASAWEGVIKICFFLTVPAYVFALTYADSIVLMLYGSQYDGAIILFRITILFAFVRMLFGAILCDPIFYLLKRKTIYLKIFLLGGLLNVLLDLLLIPWIGVVGAVIATSFSTVITGLFALVYLFKFINITIPVKFEIKILSICVLALIPTLMWGSDNLFLLIMKGLAYALFIVVFMVIIKPLNDGERNLLKEIDSRLYAVAKFF